MAEFKYEIVRNLGTIGEGTKGWRKEVNIINWNGRGPKVDIRDWSENHEKIGRGVTLRKDEAIELKQLLQEVDINDLDIG